MKQLVLYSTLGCHLCEIAEALLANVLDLNNVEVEIVDISESDELVERYGVRIPVLADPATGAELGWPFAAAQVQAFLASEA